MESLLQCLVLSTHNDYTRQAWVILAAINLNIRMRVVSNFGDSDFRADEIHTYGRNFEGGDFRARLCTTPGSPKLEATRSLLPHFSSPRYILRKSAVSKEDIIRLH